MPKKSVLDLHEMKRAGEKITWLTAYDYPTARFEEAAGVDMILVGDSLGMCVYGYPGTVPVTMDQCIVHCEAVRRGAPDTFVMGDMPFMSYQVSDEDAVRNAGRFLKEAGVDAVKLEGGVRVISRVRAILDAGIVVCGHIGLTPQSSGQLGGHKAQGRTLESAQLVVEDARALAERGRPAPPARGGAARGGRLHPRRARRSPSSASAPATTSTASCSSSATCSACSRRSRPSSSRSTPTSPASRPPRSPSTSPTCAAAPSPQTSTAT